MARRLRRPSLPRPICIRPIGLPPKPPLSRQHGYCWKVKLQSGPLGPGIIVQRTGDSTLTISVRGHVGRYIKGTWTPYGTEAPLPVG